MVTRSSLTNCKTSIALSLWLSVFSVSGAAQKYAIRLHHPERAGSKYHLSAGSSETTRVKVIVADQIVRTTEEEFTLKLSADVTILEANSAGWARRKSFTIVSSTFIKGTAAGPLLTPGTVVLASIQNGATNYEVNGKPVNDTITKALRSVITLHVASVDDDDLFGTPEPERVTGSWTPNVEAITKLLKEMGAQVTKVQISGSGILEKIERNHLGIRSSFFVNNALLPMPAGFKAEGGEIHAELSGRFPIRQMDMERAEVHRLRIGMIGAGRLENGVEAKLNIEYESNLQFEVTRIAKH